MAELSIKKNSNVESSKIEMKTKTGEIKKIIYTKKRKKIYEKIIRLIIKWHFVIAYYLSTVLSQRTHKEIFTLTSCICCYRT